MRQVTHFVGGKPWTGGASEWSGSDRRHGHDGAARQGEVFDPATGQLTGQVDLASAADVAGVVAVA